MATNPKKHKADRKSSKRTEEVTPVEEKKEEVVEEASTVVLEETQTVVEEETAPPPSPSSEQVYEEPVLTKLIVLSYEGGQEKGLYEGEGEASYDGGHTYKGQFSAGMMHGKGIYVWSDGVVYEGEFLHNKVFGKGSYQWPDGSTYQGDVVNGMRHGAGTFRTKDNKLSYQGEWCQGRRHGKGRMEFDSEGQSYYEGDWVNNVKHGWGVRCYPSGNIYQGMWFNNVRHGEGSMRWLDRNQMYTGQWEDGVQHGLGQNIWFLHRIGASQYPVRNMYDGEFVKGSRHGHGVYYYANGARYEGDWVDNMKNGKGRFVFKNGRIYDGVFEKDHIIEFPNFDMDGLSTPDMSQIRTRTPLPSENVSVISNSSKNTYSPSLQLDIYHVLEELPEEEREEEETQVMYAILRHLTVSRKVYIHYSSLGYEQSPDNTFIMSRLQFWRLLKDCRLHHRGLCLMAMDRLLVLHPDQKDSCHNPHVKILFREFVNNLIILAYHLFHHSHQGKEPLLAWCLSQLFTQHILPYACVIKGNVFVENRRAINALVHMNQSYQVFKTFSQPRKNAPEELTLKMRQFLFLIKDLKLISSDLTAAAVISVLSEDDPNVVDEGGAISLEMEMTFLEFLEALVGCAQVYVTEAVVKDPSTPRPSTMMTQADQTLSMPPSPYRSQMDEAGEERTIGESSPQEGDLETSSPQLRSASHQSTKTTDDSSKETGESEPGQMESTVKTDASLADGKKSASYMSSRSGGRLDSGGPLLQSQVSLTQTQSEMEQRGEGEDDEELYEEEEGEEEEMDEATRQFNFWTHQVHIFFVRKFFPAVQHLLTIDPNLTQ